jgi:hypothetical protein
MKNMKDLKIEFTGGYRQVSKHLTLEHSANFAVIVDVLVYIHNENSDKLVNINGNWAVRASNAFLSRQTGLGLSTIKVNIDKIEKIGLVTVITKGQGNTRHYVINIKNINAYITALKPKFKLWYDKSIVSSKKDKARSVEADNIRLKKSQAAFAKTIAEIEFITGESKVGLVENRPTQIAKTRQPNMPKPTVADTAKKRAEETTTKKKNGVVQSSSNKTQVSRDPTTEKKLMESAIKETSDANWDRLEQAYNSLRDLPSQGRFLTSHQDKLNFYSLSEERQEYVIKSVVVLKNYNSTASRPALYIDEALKPRPKRINEPYKILNVCL